MFTELQYSTGRPSQRPAAPVQLPSTAGLVGQGPVVVPVVAGSNLVTLPSSDPDGDALTTKLRSLPSTGTLRNAAGATLGVGSTVSDAGPAVYYTPSGTVGAGFTDSFTYGVSDGGAEVTASVQLVRHAMPQVMDVGTSAPPSTPCTLCTSCIPAASRILRTSRQPVAKSYAFNEDALSYVVLGKPYVAAQTKVSVMMQVVITSLPARGTLYQVQPPQPPQALPALFTLCTSAPLHRPPPSLHRRASRTATAPTRRYAPPARRPASRRSRRSGPR